MTLHLAFRRAPVICLVAFLAGFTHSAFSQPSGGLQLPPGATSLEGIPVVQVETTRERATRRELDPATANEHRLTIRLVDGRLFWARAGDEPLAVSSAGAFTYLMAREPGKYVRIRRVNDKLTYVEHLDTAAGSVTYWGELRIVLGKRH